MWAIVPVRPADSFLYHVHSIYSIYQYAMSNVLIIQQKNRYFSHGELFIPAYLILVSIRFTTKDRNIH